MAADSNSSISCTRCGACLSVCPIYDLTRHEMFSPRGRARLFSGLASGAWREEFSLKDVKILETLSACLQCGACSSVCPVGVEVDDIVRGVRRDARYLSGPSQALLWGLLKRPEFMSSIVRLLPGVPKVSGLILRFSGLLGAQSRDQTGCLALPEISSRPAVSRGLYGIKGGSQGSAGEKKIVLFFVGCIQNYVYPEVAEAIARCLGGALTVPVVQVCCGMPAFVSGLVDQARALALSNIRAIEEVGDFDVVMTGCASCAAMIRRWPSLFEDGSDKDAALKIASRVMQFSDFVMGARMALEISERYAGLVMTYHVPCHERFVSGAPGRAGATEGLLRCLNPEHFRSTPKGCCGHGGVFSLKHAGLSRKIFGKRLEVMGDNGVDVVVTTCSGCLLQFRTNLPPESDLKVLHLAEVLSRATL